MTKLTKTGFIFLAFLLAGCAHLSKDRAATPQLPIESSATIWDSSHHRWIDEADLIKGLRDARYIVIGELVAGELHQSRYLQEQLLNLLKALNRHQRLGAVAMDSLQSKLNTEELTYLEQLEKRSPALHSRYKTLIEWLEKEEIPVIAAAVPVAKLRAMKDKEARKWLKTQTGKTLSEQQIKQLRDIMSQSHPAPAEGIDEKVDYLLAAQQLQDYFMARLLLAVKENSVLITRAFHARNDIGLTPYIKAAEPDARVKSLLMLSATEDSDQLQNSLKAISGQYDYIWLISPRR
ncbi:ChaN family lipoprotein [Endozoicomonas gorgoniicola]|uniref:ChaN family lipoprotein n=1 Tax=Endozoicomonas gorgoniicola TaxID=1234144 RepID=A0ABT3N212_9GAMM|nr:ChaN family lipoprotein [Endozoicomonas gorgoniicola]MCW7555654.1 ChaN family lipoprotein [Endozoicomonas gorgoniicola]